LDLHLQAQPVKMRLVKNATPLSIMDNYQCQICSTLIQSNSSPNVNGCPGGSVHRWTKLGSVGGTNYQCKKCGTLVKTATMPNVNGCPKGSVHQWTKL
jgi:DNA-directed RNA polymerase subunit RPC12/RpoP